MGATSHFPLLFGRLSPFLPALLFSVLLGAQSRSPPRRGPAWHGGPAGGAKCEMAADSVGLPSCGEADRAPLPTPSVLPAGLEAPLGIIDA